MSVTHPDSLGKIVQKYFAVITKVPFDFNGTTVKPRPLLISTGLARGYTCPPNCGACCPKFSLDYLPDEAHPPGVTERLIEFNDRKVKVYTDFQSKNSTRHCRHVSSVDARCAIHPIRPLSCDFELIRCYLGLKQPWGRISVAPFGRAWALTKAVGNEKGTLCEILPPSDKSIQDTIRKLRRLEAWATHFGLAETWLPEIIQFLEATKGAKGNITLVP